MSFKIPYYRQSTEFSCGPACLLMIFKCFDKDINLNRTLEFEVWRQCNMIGVRGADPFGMSVPLLDAGHETFLLPQWRQTIDHDLWGVGCNVEVMPKKMPRYLFGGFPKTKSVL